MKQLFRAAAAAIVAFLPGGILHADFYVAVDGTDSAPGTAGQPFATVAHACAMARSLPAGAPRRVIVGGGKYFAVTMELNSADDGLDIEAAPGETPILYGGVRLTGWKKDGDRFYSAVLPQPWFRTDLKGADGAPKPPSWVQMLQVDEKWAVKARYPGTGYLTHLSEFKVPWLSTTAGGFQRKPTVAELTTLIYKPADFPVSMEWTNAQLEIFHVWDESTVGVSSNDASHHTLTLAPPAAYPPGAFGVQKYVVWNTIEGMTSPGHWFHDRSRNCIVYWPFPGQDMNTAEVIVPVMTRIIHLGGTPEKPIKNLQIKGLTLCVTNTPMASAGFAAESLDGAISIDQTENCTLEDLVVLRVGGQAINSRSPSVGLQVRDCEVAECGAGGIYVSGTSAVITNNQIHDVGLQYTAAVGLFRGGHNFLVTHNEIHDAPYSAISYGGTENIIQDNLIYNCMKTLHDGAAVYLSGAKNCVVRGNLVRNLGAGAGADASSFYLDEQCENCVVERNLSANVNWPSQNNMARNNIIRNNIFTASGDLRLGFTNCSGFTLEKNVIYATGKISIVNIGAVGTWSRNLLYSQAGMIEGITQRGSTNTGTVKGVLGDTINADPLFQNLQSGDYRFLTGSPAVGLGIEPLDVSHAGRVH